ARTVHDLYFEPKYQEFRTRTVWSLSNAFASAFKELDAIPQFQGHCEARRVPEDSVFEVVLAVRRGTRPAAARQTFSGKCDPNTCKLPPEASHWIGTSSS
ncbi:MAG: hypothetical protein WCC99_05980, partial [Candidatus Sulfotelmatobacter sp.]